MLIRRRTKIILAALLAFFILFPTDVYKLVFFSHTQEFTVTKNDAPEYCNKWHKSPWNWYGNTRSSVPEHEFEGFCGSIQTDMGYYKLPENNSFFGINVHRSRQDLDRRLKEGCRFRVLILGFGKKFEPGDKPRAPIIQTISRILDEHGCEEAGQDTASVPGADLRPAR